MRLILIGVFTPAVALVAVATRAAPPALEDLTALDARIAAYLDDTSAAGAISARPVDRRLRLLRCAEPVRFDQPSHAALVVSCPSQGWHLRVTLMGATAVARTEMVVRRGDAVELGVAGDGFGITTAAVALEDGRIGDSVRVKTSTGSTTLTARVGQAGRVTIGD